MNSLKSFVTGFFLWGILGGISAQDKVLSFSMPDGAGTLRLGVIENNSSRWLDEKQTQLHIDCQPLSNTKGFILEIENKREDITLGWAFGGCDATTPETDIEPQYCKDNVFNVEGTQVTIYHGKVMQLKVTNLIVPSASSIRLSDGHKQDTPLTLLTSGKKTDAPVLAGTWLIRKGE